MQGSHLLELKRDRLFGKEITNLVDSKLPKKDFRLNHHAKKNPLSQRGLSEDFTRRNVSQVCRTSRNLLEVVKPNASVNKTQKTEPPAVESLESPQHVPEYFKECFGFMLQQEKYRPSDATYMSTHKDMNESMRIVLLDWLLDIHYRFKMFPSTLFIAVSIIDRYLAGNEISRSKLQLVGATALFIAAKYEETYEVPELSEMVRLCAKVYTKHEFLEMESVILRFLDFDLIVDSSYKFLEPLSKIDQMENKYFFLSRYILELSLFDLKTYKYKPSLLAASAIYLTNKLKKKARCWSPDLEEHCGYTEQDIRPCAKELLLILERASVDPLLKSIKKKFSSASYCEVSKLRF